jgi:hypothetical protein
VHHSKIDRNYPVAIDFWLEIHISPRRFIQLPTSKYRGRNFPQANRNGTNYPENTQGQTIQAITAMSR